ncbi:MAG: hypothetical protein QM737_22500 [Ferruginibacter sp.]
MKTEFNFKIKANGNISGLFLKNNISDFSMAMELIRKLPYGRNKNKADLACVFTDNCGTCGTKHAILKALANENAQPETKLVIGLFRMNKINTPAVASVLDKNALSYIPEAHTYLKINNEIVDCTTMHSSGSTFINDLITEVEIEPAQITDFKVNFQKTYLQEWLLHEPGLAMSLEELWIIREDCIAALSNQ